VFRQIGTKIITKRIKVDFISQQQVSAVIGDFVKEVFQKTMALAIKHKGLSKK